MLIEGIGIGIGMGGLMVIRGIGCMALVGCTMEHITVFCFDVVW